MAAMKKSDSKKLPEEYELFANGETLKIAKLLLKHEEYDAYYTLVGIDVGKKLTDEEMKQAIRRCEEKSSSNPSLLSFLEHYEGNIFMLLILLIILYLIATVSPVAQR